MVSGLPENQAVPRSYLQEHAPMTWPLGSHGGSFEDVLEYARTYKFAPRQSQNKAQESHSRSSPYEPRESRCFDLPSALILLKNPQYGDSDTTCSYKSLFTSFRYSPRSDFRKSSTSARRQIRSSKGTDFMLRSSCSSRPFASIVLLYLRMKYP